MKNKKPLILFLIDLMVFCSILCAYYRVDFIHLHNYFEEILKTILIYGSVYILSYQHKVNERIHIYQLLYFHVTFIIILIACCTISNYFKFTSVPFSDIFFLELAFVYLILSFGIKKIVINWFRSSSFHSSEIKPSIMLGHDSYATAFINDLSYNKWLGYKIINTIDEIFMEDQYINFLKYIEEHNIRAIFINSSKIELNYERTQFFNKLFEQKLIEIKLISEQYANKLKRSSYDLFGHFPVVNMFEFPLDRLLNRMIKRTFDLVFSLSVILFILSWMIPLLSIIIWLDSKGPIFYKHYRVGYLKLPFTCFKFRTMKTTDEPQPFSQTVRNDTRVTRVGRILRKYNLDEMPQFINVFFGDISVVGPRPMMMEHMQEFENDIEEMYSRHWIKPGVTGLAQVMGYRGEIDSVQKMKGRIRNDLNYIYNWSFFLDLKIIWWTIRNMIQGDKNAI